MGLFPAPVFNYFLLILGLFPIPVFDDFFQISAETPLRKSL